MAKRVSLKGRGADIFFGDYESPGQAPAPGAAGAATAPSEEAEPIPPTSPAQGKLARMQESKKASSTASVQANTHSGQPRKRPLPARGNAVLDRPPVASGVISQAWQYVNERATVTNAFRYTDRELSWLTDALYEVGKRHGVKLSKQDAARLGLNLVLEDYRTRGDDSLLSEFACRRKRQGVE